jgi:hypothetical protein
MYPLGLINSSLGCVPISKPGIRTGEVMGKKKINSAMPDVFAKMVRGAGRAMKDKHSNFQNAMKND